MYLSGDLDVISDGKTLLYESDQDATIASRSTLGIHFSNFKYNEATSPSLISMVDGSSQLHLEHSILQATQPLTLSTGTVITTGDAFLKGDLTLNLQGLSALNINGGLTKTGNVLL